MTKRNKGGRPPMPDTERRVPISIRIAPETLDRFRATGPGWQGRMNAALDRAAARLAPVEEGSTR